MPWLCLEVTWQLVLPALGPLPLRMWVGCVRARSEDCRVLAPGATIHPLSGAELRHPQGSSQNLWPPGAGLHAFPASLGPCGLGLCWFLDRVLLRSRQSSVWSRETEQTRAVLCGPSLCGVVVSPLPCSSRAARGARGGSAGLAQRLWGAGDRGLPP